jgi:hypothetical protein
LAAQCREPVRRDGSYGQKPVTSEPKRAATSDAVTAASET